MYGPQTSAWEKIKIFSDWIFAKPGISILRHEWMKDVGTCFFGIQIFRLPDSRSACSGRTFRVFVGRWLQIGGEKIRWPDVVAREQKPESTFNLSVTSGRATQRGAKVFFLDMISIWFGYDFDMISSWISGTISTPRRCFFFFFSLNVTDACARGINGRALETRTRTFSAKRPGPPDARRRTGNSVKLESVWMSAGLRRFVSSTEFRSGRRYGFFRKTRNQK